MQAVLLQLCGIAYEYLLLMLVNAQQMQHFSVLLALPSATIRAMTSRPCQVREATLMLVVGTCGQNMWCLMVLASPSQRTHHC